MGDWRDTLFVWRGVVSQAEKSSRARWAGRWVAVEGCRDARAAPTPSGNAFSQADAAFDVAGVVVSGSWAGNRVYTKPPEVRFEENNGRGWQLADGEDGELHWHRDGTHVVRLVDDVRYGEANPYADKLALAVGRNDFGAFISVGMSHISGDGNELTLARRYLAPGDVRAKWSLEDLQKEVEASLPGSESPKPVSVPKWGQHPAWRCAALHGALRKRGPPPTGSQPVALNLTGPFELRLTLVRDERNYLRVGDNVEWVEQCWTCGREASPSSNFFVMEWTDEEPNEELIRDVHFCGPTCVHGFAPHLARISREWASSRFATGFFLKTDENVEFWEAVESDPASKEALKDWELEGGDGEYILRCDGDKEEQESDEDDLGGSECG